MSIEDPSENKLTSGKATNVASSAWAVLGSTFASMALILSLLLIVRWLLPPLLESSRYSWYRGQLRAENEAATDQLRNVSLDGLSRISQLVSQRVTPSVVHIGVNHSFFTSDMPDDSGDNLSTDEDSLKLSGQGSGILIDQDGFILTNYHVVEKADSIEVRFSDASTDEATIVGIDRARDLAVLKVRPTKLPAMTWGDSDLVTVGSPVWAVGSPFGLDGSVTFGILSSKHRVDLSDSEYRYANRIQSEYSDLMQSDVAVNPGNSGGPLVSARGELIGINTAILGSTFQGVSFSIPSNLAKKLYEDIQAKSKDAVAWLGVALDDATGVKSQRADAKPMKALPTGAVVVGFRYGRSPARESGILRGDIITGYDGAPIRSGSELIDKIRDSSPGTKVRLRLIRQGATRDLEVVLGTRFVELEIADEDKSS